MVFSEQVHHFPDLHPELWPHSETHPLTSATWWLRTFACWNREIDRSSQSLIRCFTSGIPAWHNLSSGLLSRPLPRLYSANTFKHNANHHLHSANSFSPQPAMQLRIYIAPIWSVLFGCCSREWDSTIERQDKRRSERCNWSIFVIVASSSSSEALNDEMVGRLLRLRQPKTSRSLTSAVPVHLMKYRHLYTV